MIFLVLEKRQVSQHLMNDILSGQKPSDNKAEVVSNIRKGMINQEQTYPK